MLVCIIARMIAASVVKLISRWIFDGARNAWRDRALEIEALRWEYLERVFFFFFFFRQKAGVRVIFIERSKRRKNFLKLVLAFVLKIVFWWINFRSFFFLKEEIFLLKIRKFWFYCPENSEREMCDETKIEIFPKFVLFEFFLRKKYPFKNQNHVLHYC